MHIRPATEQDAEIILHITKAAFAEYVGVLDPPSGVTRETVAVVQQKLRDGTYLLAEQDGAPVGVVYCYPEGDHMYLGRLAVLPSQRKQGVAQQLVAAVEARAQAAHLPEVVLGVRVALPHLRDWYERNGYRLFEERRHDGYDHTTFVMLKKTLPGRIAQAGEPS